MTGFVRVAIAASLSSLLATSVLASQGSGDLESQPDARAERTLRLRPMAPGAAIEIDGRIDEPAWERAARLGPLTQVVPIEGADMSYPTDVRVTFDEENVYVAIFAHDDPAEVRARQMERDAFVRFDDVIELWFDPFASQRFAYWFQVTAGGSLGDALIADDGSSFNKDWDGIWYGESRITSEGWVAELRFPIKTLSFDPDAPWWGFNVRRKRIANGEEGRWASPSNAYRFFQISEGGRLVGIENMRQGIGLDVTPYIKYQADRESSDRSFGSLWDVGATIRWRPTPTSTVLLTTNTDFAETEVDTRQINTNRFPLFFPERRDFFLEDAGVFEFGAPSNRRSLVPFFSRRVGRTDGGEVVPILAGAKVTGRFGDWTVGALDTYLGDKGDVDRENLGVVRIQRSLGGGQQIGAIATTGDPTGEGGPTRGTFGVDARLGSTRLFGEGRSGFLWSYVLGTTSGDAATESDGLAFGVEAQARSSNWSSRVTAERRDEDFRPALGFVRRRGVEEASVSTDYVWRSDDRGTLFRQIETGIRVEGLHDLVGDEDRWSVPLDLFEAQFWSEDSVYVEVARRAEVIDDSFSAGPSAVVRPGDYDETRYEFGFESNDRRLYGIEASFEAGDFYGGRIERIRAEPLWIPSKHLQVALSFEDVQIDLGADGNRDTQLYGLRFDVGIDPFTAWKTFAQYDTDAEDLSVQSRVRWILEPGRELFLVGLFGFEREDRHRSFATREQSLAVKLTATFRF